MKPENYNAWLKNQEKYWAEEKSGATTTKGFFDSLAKGGWQCVECTLPKNPNWARRIQDLKSLDIHYQQILNDTALIAKPIKPILFFTY